jgi:uncharacterized protein YggE
MSLKTHSVVSLCFVALFFQIGAQEDVTIRRNIVVTGLGQVSGRPDMVTLTSGVVTEGPSATEGLNATEALTQNSESMQQIFGALSAFEIPEEDVQTSGFFVSPQYSRPEPMSGEQPELMGYRVTNRITIKLREVDRLGELLDILVSAGANNVDSIQFSISDPMPLMDEARASAVENAQHIANVLTLAANVTLGEVLTMEEGHSNGPLPIFASARASSMDSTPIAVGESTVSASVSMRFAIQ